MEAIVEPLLQFLLGFIFEAPGEVLAEILYELPTLFNSLSFRLHFPS